MKIHNNAKSGVTFVILVLTIVVALILLSVTVVSISRSIDSALITSFAQDVSKIQEATEKYYLQHDEFPILSGTDVMSEQQVLDMLDDETKKNMLKTEMIANGDNSQNTNLGSFYKINLSELGVEKTTRGILANDDDTDVYVVSYPSMNVYYVKGIKARGDYFFSLTSKISGLTNVSANENVSVEELQSSGIVVKKKTKNWTNKMGITLDVNMASGETLYMSVAGGELRQITTKVGANSFYFDSLTDIIDGKANIKVPDLTKKEDEDFRTIVLQLQKTIDIIKKKGDEEIGRVQIDLSNYDTIAPIKSTETSLVSGENENIITFKVSDTVCGIKDVRYEYLAKFNENAERVQYYEGVDSYDLSYMKTRGKKADVSETGEVSLSLPKNIEGVYIVVFDKAGNGIGITQTMYRGMYIDCKVNSITNTNADFTILLNSLNGTSTVQTELSVDGGKTYSNPLVFNINTSTQISTLRVKDYNNLTNVNGNIYIRVTAENKAGVRDVRVFNLSATSEPYIPDGFTYLEGTLDTGFVIKDLNNGNEFVWVPVDDINDFKMQIDNDPSDISMYTSAVTEEERASVEKYGGFYIGRYETGLNDEATYSSTVQDGTNWQNATATIKKNVRPWNYITFDKAFSVSQELYPGHSNLMSLSNYATTLNWLQKTEQIEISDVINDSSTWGNYQNSQFTIDEKDYAKYAISNYTDGAYNYLSVSGLSNYTKPKDVNYLIFTTGASNYTKRNNIFDLAGSLGEFIIEISSSGNKVVVGPNYFNISNFEYSAALKSQIYDDTFPVRGFRVVYYL